MRNQFMVAVLLSSALLAGCASENKNRDRGAGIGAAAGAVLGGVIGHQSGNRERGAILGAAMGGAIGGVAVNHWAAEPMVTQDLDFVVVAESIEQTEKD